MKKIFLCFLLIFSFLVIPYIGSATVFANGDSSSSSSSSKEKGDLPDNLEWVNDENLTLVAKNTARFGMLFDWSMQNYHWICVVRSSDSSCDNTRNPLQKLWGDVRTFIVVPLLILSILGTSIVLITTHGSNLTLSRLIPNFLLALIFIFFSFAIITILYQFTDAILGFFLRNTSNPCPPACISQANLLYAGWDYKEITGMRLNDPIKFGESTLMSTILIELSGITYFVISAVLMIRKIVLWFFLISSPILPIFFFFPPLRSIGKSWASIFIKWLLYAPVFGIFLHSTTYLWSNLPLAFTNPSIGDPSKVIFPTSINFALGIGRPGTFNNSLNITDTFAQYLFALFMLWTVVILPWILIKYTINFNDNSVLMKTLVRINMNLKSTYQRSILRPISNPNIQNNSFTILNTPFVKKPIPNVGNTQNPQSTNTGKPV